MPYDFNLIDINSCVVCADHHISGGSTSETADFLNLSYFTSDITTYHMAGCITTVDRELNQNILKENFI